MLPFAENKTQAQEVYSELFDLDKLQGSDLFALCSGRAYSVVQQ